MTNTELKREHPKFSHPQSIVPGVSAGNILESHEPHGVPMKDMWSHQKDHMQLVSPLNRRKFEVLVVGTGLSAGAAAAALGERTVLSRLEAGCTAPVAAVSHWEGEQLVVRGGVFALDGSRQLIAQAQGEASEAEELGRAVSEELFAQGAADLLAAE